jgi:hypothetical protein
MTPQQRFNEWQVVLNEVQNCTEYTILHKFAIKGLVANSGQDCAYLKRVISQKFIKRHSLTDSEMIQFKQQMQYCKTCKSFYSQATYLAGVLNA